ncbi:hypothetical protein [Methylocystis echinoides]|uniref:Histidine phosphatase family protein n=1 Tax=Methylocystis echinoides TaxID=29468 RepID=A0A9W6GWW6_9HYPH|nr:hypothetical protein [Methylocystis echinoides]GLI94426.1 hypothetical protein LMG27198_34180 [Methylocystis echinoides]
MRGVGFVLLGALMALPAALPARADARCTPAPAPQSWRGETPAIPVPPPDAPTALNPLTLVLFRHAEKPMRADGVMIEDGNLGADALTRLARLPDVLLGQFGCPDLLVAPNPAVKMRNKATGDYFNYVRPLATILPLAAAIEYPVWTPYGYDQNDALARDLLADRALAPDDKGRAKTVFVAWERTNIGKLVEKLASVGHLAPREGSIDVDGARYACERPTKWAQCDFDSIWLVHIRDGALCLTRRQENLNTAGFQNQCKGAESATDQPAAK